MTTATNISTCSLKPTDITKLERIQQLKAELKELEKEMKPKLQAQPVGIFKVGARSIQITEIAKVTVSYKNMIVDNLGQSWIDEHAAPYSTESVSVQYKLLGRA